MILLYDYIKYILYMHFTLNVVAIINSDGTNLVSKILKFYLLYSIFILDIYNLCVVKKN